MNCSLISNCGVPDSFCFALSSHLGLIEPCFCVAVAGGEGERSGCSMSSRTPQPYPTRTSVPLPLLMSNTRARAGVHDLGVHAGGSDMITVKFAPRFHFKGDIQ